MGRFPIRAPPSDSMAMPVRRAVAPLILATVLAPPALPGQEPVGAYAGTDSTFVDRVAAVVGDSVILLSEVQTRFLAAQAQGQAPDPRALLSDLVDEQVVLQAAARDTTLVIPDEELNSRVDQAMQEIRGRFGSEEAFLRALEQQGMTRASLRDTQRELIRTTLLQQLFMRRQLLEAPPVAVSEAEMRAFYDERRTTLPERPELLTLHQILVPVKASEEAWASARALADSLHGEIEAGADFETVAREHSHDQGSAADGGDLGWFRRGNMIREFEQVAFNLRPGTIAPPVKTDFGWHVIRTDRARPGEVKARHILIRPEVTEADRQAALARAGEVAEAARNGANLRAVARAGEGEDQPEVFDELADRSREDLANIPNQGYQANLVGVSEGEVVGPFRTLIGAGEFFAVLRVEEVREEGELTFEDLREQIRTSLSEQKKAERILARLRSSTYIDLRM